MSYDPDSGELFPNGKISDRVAEAAVKSKIALKQHDMGVGKRDLHEAMQRLFASLPVWITNDKAGAHKVKYLTLKGLLDVVKPKATEHGLRLKFGAGHLFQHGDGGNKDRYLPVYLDIIHAYSGDVERTEIAIPIVKHDPQSLGSALTYGRRYVTLLALGLATDDAMDDDGEGAMPRNIAETTPDRPLLVALKAEIDKITSPTDLVAWSDEDNRKVRDRLNKLTDAETERLRAHYTEHGKKITANLKAKE
jgi:hypothetical protein